MTLLTLAGCSSFKPIETVKNAGIKTGEFFGIIDERSTMKVPDYYATKQLQKHYEYGKRYDLQHIDCSSQTKNCYK